MRPIIFRGKEITNGTWQRGNLFQEGNRSWIVVQIEIDGDGEVADLFGTEWYEVDSKTVGQLTGLKDKNGEDIFEGDGIRYSGSNGIEDFIIVYEYGTFVTRSLENETDYPDSLQANSGDFHIHWTILGNKFDNPSRFSTKY